MKRALLAAAIPLAGFVLQRRASAEEPVVAVMSSDLSAYREALRGFEDALGQQVTVLPVSQSARLPAGTKVVAVFGGRAASRRYPEGVFVVSCLTPGLPADPPRGVTRVRMVPPPDQLLGGIRGAQPAARRVAVLYSNAAFEEYAAALAREGSKRELEVRPVIVDDLDELPDLLRALLGSVDALWLAPDPDLISERSFSVLREFARSTRLPLYAPTSELVREGATGAIAVSFFEAGRAAGKAVKRALAGESLPPRLYAEKVDLVFDAQQADRVGLKLSTSAVRVEARAPIP